MAELPARFLVHRVVVEPFLGSGAYGDRFGAPVEFPCWIDEKRRLVRDEVGNSVVAEGTLLCPTELVTVITPKSRVTFHPEAVGIPRRTTRVIAQSLHTDGGLGAWQHLEVSTS